MSVKAERCSSHAIDHISKGAPSQEFYARAVVNQAADPGASRSPFLPDRDHHSGAKAISRSRVPGRVIGIAPERPVEKFVATLDIQLRVPWPPKRGEGAWKETVHA